MNRSPVFSPTVLSLLALITSAVALIAATLCISSLDEAQRCCEQCKQRITSQHEKIGKVMSWGHDLENAKLGTISQKIDETREYYLRALASTDKSIGIMRAQMVDLKKQVDGLQRQVYRVLCPEGVCK